MRAEIKDGKLYIDGTLTTPTEDIMCKIRMQSERYNNIVKMLRDDSRVR